MLRRPDFLVAPPLTVTICGTACHALGLPLLLSSAAGGLRLGQAQAIFALSHPRCP